MRHTTRKTRHCKPWKAGKAGRPLIGSGHISKLKLKEIAKLRKQLGLAPATQETTIVTPDSQLVSQAAGD